VIGCGSGCSWGVVLVGGGVVVVLVVVLGTGNEPEIKKTTLKMYETSSNRHTEVLSVTILPNISIYS